MPYSDIPQVGYMPPPLPMGGDEQQSFPAHYPNLGAHRLGFTWPLGHAEAYGGGYPMREIYGGLPETGFESPAVNSLRAGRAQMDLMNSLAPGHWTGGFLSNPLADSMARFEEMRRYSRHQPTPGFGPQTYYGMPGY